jgi:hypothetical protein
MPALKDRPERDPNKKSSLPDPNVIDYNRYTIDELLDERNYFKSEGLNTFEIDEALRKRVY